MAIQFSTAVRNGRLNAIATAVGASPKLVLYTGSPPANCVAGATGTVLATLTLPSSWLNAASSGSATEAGGPWLGAAVAGGVIGYFRLWDSSLTNCHMQGTVGQGSGDLSFDNATLVNLQNIQVTTFTLTDANA